MDLQSLGKTYKSLSLGAVISYVSLLAMPLYFQNCSELQPGSIAFDDPSNFYETQLSSLGTGHDIELNLKVAYQKVQVINKEHVSQILTQNFLSSVYPVPNLESIIFENVSRKGTFFGGACDPLGSYSATDCNGGVADAGLNSFIESNTVRASYIIQSCEQLISANNTDNGILALLEKVNAVDADPAKDKMIQLYQLFYRVENPSVDYLQTLMDLNTDMMTTGDPKITRWKALAISVCESPGWQIL